MKRIFSLLLLLSFFSGFSQKAATKTKRASKLTTSANVRTANEQHTKQDRDTTAGKNNPNEEGSGMTISSDVEPRKLDAPSGYDKTLPVQQKENELPVQN